MDKEIEAYEGELRYLRKLEGEVLHLRELIAKFKNIFIHANPERFQEAYFICGEGGEKDSMKLPTTILICPAIGLDGLAVYTKTRDYSAPGY